MSFELGETTRAVNLERHGVDFADAVGALLDPYSMTKEDPDAEGEARFVTLGRGYTGSVLLVVWTERSGDRAALGKGDRT